MFDNEIKAIGLFFFLALLDENRALIASTKATDLFYRRMKKSPQTKPGIALVMVCRQMWEKSRGNLYRGRPRYNPDSGWLFPEGLDLSPWKEFQKSAPEDELLAMIWSQVLKISESDLSTALGITEGTIRYRVGRALRKMGSMTQSNPGRGLEVVRS